MKAPSLSGLLLLGLAGGRADASSAVPSCAVDCTDSLAKQLSPLQGMQALCHGVTRQRALFQCLVNSCQAHTYGPALGHVVSACSDLGVAISPLHPIEVLYATHAKRQIVPTQPGPVLPGPSTFHHTQTLAFNHRVSMGLECRAGADGLLTLSVDVPDPGATPPPTSIDGSLGVANAHGSADPATQTLGSPLGGSIGRNATTACTSSGAPASLVASHTLAPTQSTACPCHETDSSSVPSLQLMSATLLQGPAEQQTTTVPSSSSPLVITQVHGHAIGAPSQDCNKTTTLANNITIATNRAHLPLPVSSATQSSMLGHSSDCSGTLVGPIHTPLRTSNTPILTSVSTFVPGTITTAPPGFSTAESLCSNSSSVGTVSVATASLSWSLSVAGFSSRADDFSSTTRVDPVTSGRETTSCSSDASSSASSVQDPGASANLAQASVSLRQVSANVTTAGPSGGPMPTTSAIVSTLATLTSLSTATAAPPTYTAPGLPEPPAYLSPLPAYSYSNPVPEYGNGGASTSGSSFFTQKLPTPTPSLGSAGIMGVHDTTTTSGAGSALSSPYPGLYGQGQPPGFSPPPTPLPVQTLFLLEDMARARGATRQEEKRDGDWASADKPRPTTPDKGSGLDATSTVFKPDHVASGMHMTPSLTTSGSRILIPGLALVCAAVALALEAMGTTGR